VYHGFVIAMQRTWKRELLLLGAALLVLILLGLAGAVRKPMTSQIPHASVVANGHVISVEIADTPALRTLGLSGRSGLAENTGMLFLFPDARQYIFWMKDMRFPIDIIWIRGTKVVAVIERAAVPPFGISDEELERFIPPEDVDRVLEIGASMANSFGIVPGQTVEILLP